MTTDDLFDYRLVTADSVDEDLKHGLEAADRRVDALVAAPPGSLLAALVELDRVVADVGDLDGRTSFTAYVHPDPEVRDAGQRAETAISAWRAALPLRDDLAAELLRLDAASSTPDDPQDAWLVEQWRRLLRRNGHGLPAETRVEVRRLRARLAALESEFQRNIAEYDDGLDLTDAELDGLPATFVSGLRPGSTPGTRRVSLDYPEVDPFLEQARRRDLREQMFRKNWTKAAESNRPVAVEGLAVRRRIAELLGYPSWAAYATEIQMAGSPERALAMMDELATAFAPVNAAHLEELRALLVEDGAGADAQVEHWDRAYLTRLRTQRRVGLDPSAVAEYFPVDVVLDTLFELMGTLLGLTFPEVADPPAWSELVSLREVRDADGTLLAHVYLDLFPREGKFGHAAAFDLVRASGEGSARRPAVAALVCNFSAPSEDRPGLLRHSEVVTLFHEFGHAVHMAVSRARYNQRAGTSTERDFVEAPSQLMERWAWEPRVLAAMARHWETGEPMPADVLQRLTEARFDGAVRRTAMGLMLGRLDLRLHQATEEPDLEQESRTAAEVFGLPYPEGTFQLAGWGHLFGGYDAGYYGYLWAEIIGDDMVGKFERDGLLDPEVGRLFRTSVLEPGGSRPADELVEAFLGRPADPAAFLTARGWAG